MDSTSHTLAVDQERYSELDLREYIQIIRRRKWSAILTAMLVVGLASAYTFQQVPRYTATARVLVEPVATSVLSSEVVQPVNLETENQLVASEPVAALVRDKLGLDMPLEDLLAPLSVEPVIETEVMIISYSSPEPAFASDAANAFADSYLEYRRQQGLDDIGTEEEAVRARIEAASSQLAQLGEDLEAAQSAEDDALISTLESSRNVLLARLGVLQQQLDDLQASRAARLGGGSVIEEAEVPDSPSSPDHLSNLVLALLLGSALGVGWAFLRERLDDRLRDRGDVQKVTGAPVLATIPRIRSSKRDRRALTVVADPTGPASEAYRTLRTGLQFVATQRAIKSVLVTSPSAQEGKTTTTANLGVALAQSGRRVILVSADLRRPTLDDLFGVRGEDEAGLSIWLSKPSDDLTPLIKDPGVPNLRLVPSGPIPPNPAELLNSPLLSDLLRLLEDNSDLVLVDCAPVLPVADAAIVSNRVGGTLLVVDANGTHRSATVHARDELERVGGRIIGTVFNFFDASDGGYPYYYRSYERPRAGGSDNGEAKPKRRIAALLKRGNSTTR